MRRCSLLAVGATWTGWEGADAHLLVSSAEAGDMAALMRLLDAGVPVDSRDVRGRTSLLAATHANRIDAARLLIERGADVNAKDPSVIAPLSFVDGVVTSGPNAKCMSPVSHR